MIIMMKGKMQMERKDTYVPRTEYFGEKFSYVGKKRRQNGKGAGSKTDDDDRRRKVERLAHVYHLSFNIYCTVTTLVTSYDGNQLIS
jgi:hypothetical protein